MKTVVDIRLVFNTETRRFKTYVKTQTGFTKALSIVDIMEKVLPVDAQVIREKTEKPNGKNQYTYPLFQNGKKVGILPISRTSVNSKRRRTITRNIDACVSYAQSLLITNK